MTTAERVAEILSGPEWPDEPSDVFVDGAVRLWASIVAQKEAA